MKLLRRGGLLFRTYLTIVGGLIATAALFDYGFGRLQERLAPETNRWAETSLALIEARLAAVPAEDRAAAALALERELGVPVQFMPSDAVVRSNVAPPAGTQEIFDDAGCSIYLRATDALGGAIRMGPVDAGEPGQSGWLDLVPHAFYLTILVLVSLWLWPLIRDVDLLRRAARDFAADYRRPMATRAKATTLPDLAASFDEMSARIHGLIQGQKDLTSALSHEIRTPLARIKFAMAMLPSKAPVADEVGSERAYAAPRRQPRDARRDGRRAARRHGRRRVAAAARRRWRLGARGPRGPHDPRAHGHCGRHAARRRGVRRARRARADRVVLDDGRAGLGRRGDVAARRAGRNRRGSLVSLRDARARPARCLPRLRWARRRHDCRHRRRRRDVAHDRRRTFTELRLSVRRTPAPRSGRADPRLRAAARRRLGRCARYR